MRKPIRIATRGSELALVQANQLRDRLTTAHSLKPEDIELVIITTSGDKFQDWSLAELGGKGLFTKEIEESLAANDTDLAVHSMKDVETTLPDEFILTCYLPREDVRDAFVSTKAKSIDDLEAGAMIGTASLRRGSQIKNLRPDLIIVPFRGNVPTRLRKLQEGQVDATLLAMAGLKRLGLEHEATAPLEPEFFLPAVGQGAVGVEIRKNDKELADLLAPLNDVNTELEVTAERAFLSVLDGSCRTPIAGLARIQKDGTTAFNGMVLSPDGTETYRVQRSGTVTTPAEAKGLGRDAGNELRQSAGSDFLAQIGQASMSKSS